MTLLMVTQVPADPASRDRVAALLAGPSALPGQGGPVAGAPVLVVVGGLPATGKTTVASALARQAGFAFVRGHLVIDTATRTPAEAVAAILAAIPERPDHVPAGPD